MNWSGCRTFKLDVLYAPKMSDRILSKDAIIIAANIQILRMQKSWGYKDRK